jgi:arabinogalactan endo-1,4-beta-galactosidase
MKKSLLLTLCIVLTCTVSAQKYLGGDVSLLLTYEENGANYMDIDGKKITDLLAFLKEQGLNTMRVRLFVDPSKASAEAKGQGVRQDLEYVKKLGKKIKDAGLGFMLDFHYSDTWADPAHQTMPQEFIMVNTPAYEYIYTYTKNSLEAMVTAGATPDFIQIGNEISFGMLWDGCKVKHNSDWTAYLDDNWDSFSKALKNASKACREVCPEAKIIIHTEQCANNPTLDVAFFNRIKANEVNYDIIGTSYYPYYKGPISNLDKGLTQLEINFPDKQIMIVETGCGYHYKMGDKETGYPLTYEGQQKFTAELITMLNKHQHVNGLFWWFLEANEYGLDWKTKRVTDKWYDASLFDNETGHALPALYELKNFVSEGAGISSLSVEDTGGGWYNLNGKNLKEAPTQKGLYIYRGQKVVVK